MSLNPEALDRWITGNYGEDQFSSDMDGYLDAEPDVVPQDEVTATCDKCGYEEDQHHLESREDAQGNDYEYLACPPEEVQSDDDDFAHWIKTGCADLLPKHTDSGAPYCGGCGDLLPDDGTCIECHEHPRREEGRYAGLCHDCGYQAHLEDEADRKRDEY